MKQLIIKIDINDKNEMFVSTEQNNLTRLETVGILEQVKHLLLSQNVEEPVVPTLSDVIEEKEDNIVPLNP